jgi:hypothetical protein
MKKLIATVAIVMALATPASAATIGFDIGKAQNSINKAVTQIVNAPSFDWSALLEAWK